MVASAKRPLVLEVVFNSTLVQGSLMFKQISINNWRQFEHVDLAFHPKLTLLTGANGAGKTTILNLLNRHFGWNLQFVSTPKKSKKGLLKYASDFWMHFPKSPEAEPPPLNDIGSITYQDGDEANLQVPSNVQHAYEVQITGMKTMPGTFVPSHRPVFIYQQVQQIPTRLNAKRQLLDTYLAELRNSYQSGGRRHSASFRIKEALISLATFGYGNPVVTPDEEAIQTFEGFQSILQIVLPRSLGFKRFAIRMPEIVLETDTGEFSFDSVSGGIASIMDLAWQIYMCSLVYESKFTVVMDEPENHLHPSLQREMLPSFLKAFPQIQFIAATHNPFVVSSVPDSHVYVLDYNNNNKVTSTQLDLVNKAGTSNEILRSVLGVPVTMPIWVEERIQSIVETYEGSEVNEKVLMSIREQMKSLGLEKLFPEVVAKVLKDEE
ncbi:MAG: AAA family ATPase [Planctomycetaceae bacterium]|nr:AAA family ATPase [Planctomycetaceae bacterium]